MRSGRLPEDRPEVRLRLLPWRYSCFVLLRPELAALILLICDLVQREVISGLERSWVSLEYRWAVIFRRREGYTEVSITHNQRSD